MTNVLHGHIDFQPRPVSHAPSPFGFGFGLGASSSPLSPVASSSWGAPPTPGHTNSQSGGRDESMDRSPTPERPKRAAPKRARLVPTNDGANKENGSSTPTKASGGSQDEIDVGVLLASLPTQSLLPLFLKLMKSRPELKSDVLSMIPKPTLETALQALEQASKKLKDAYPYSSAPSSSTSFGFGSSMQHSHFSQPQPNQGGMRDSYILSRIQPHITEFVSCCISYLPYFTSNQSSEPQPAPGSHLTQAIQSMHKQTSHPVETFTFLSRVMTQILSFPPLAISSIPPHLLHRLVVEWQTWVDVIDNIVNKQGGMFGSEAVRGWEGVLDELANSRAVEVSTTMRPVRDKWVVKVGWLLGRQAPHAMDEH
ncbi:hypothetical protein DFP72DRAFT_865709 [Ephemerocybe angulata]|uniref:Tethering factor for nuclear proteasome STS1 n=1 Tax=Ephemerocybe angulata TaxID=980116 RepID=A0A8H6IL53_9AGAR|nr:hypothetical protein DFP72DRAFT_865709 [Tulosesus angulatus]